MRRTKPNSVDASKKWCTHLSSRSRNGQFPEGAASPLDGETLAADGLLPGEAVGQHTQPITAHAVLCRAEARKGPAPGYFFDRNSWFCSRAKQNSEIMAQEL